MKRLPIFFFALSIAALGHAQNRSLTICPAGPEYKAGATKMTCQPTGYQCYVYPDTLLTQRDLVATRPANHKDMNVLLLEFKPEAKKIIYDATTRYLGQYLAVLFDGKLISVLRINVPLNREVLLIDGKFTGESVVEAHLDLEKLIGNR